MKRERSVEIDGTEIGRRKRVALGFRRDVVNARLDASLEISGLRFSSMELSEFVLALRELVPSHPALPNHGLGGTIAFLFRTSLPTDVSSLIADFVSSDWRKYLMTCTFSPSPLSEFRFPVVLPPDETLRNFFVPLLDIGDESVDESSERYMRNEVKEEMRDWQKRFVGHAISRNRVDERGYISDTDVRDMPCPLGEGGEWWVARLRDGTNNVLHRDVLVSPESAWKTRGQIISTDAGSGKTLAALWGIRRAISERGLVGPVVWVTPPSLMMQTKEFAERTGMFRTLLIDGESSIRKLKIVQDIGVEKVDLLLVSLNLMTTSKRVWKKCPEQVVRIMSCRFSFLVVDEAHRITQTSTQSNVFSLLLLKTLFSLNSWHTLLLLRKNSFSKMSPVGTNILLETQLRGNPLVQPDTFVPFVQKYLFEVPTPTMSNTMGRHLQDTKSFERCPDRKSLLKKVIRRVSPRYGLSRPGLNLTVWNVLVQVPEGLRTMRRILFDDEWYPSNNLDVLVHMFQQYITEPKHQRLYFSNSTSTKQIRWKRCIRHQNLRTDLLVDYVRLTNTLQDSGPKFLDRIIHSVNSKTDENIPRRYHNVGYRTMATVELLDTILTLAKQENRQERVLLYTDGRLSRLSRVLERYGIQMLRLEGNRTHTDRIIRKWNDSYASKNVLLVPEDMCDGLNLTQTTTIIVQYPQKSLANNKNIPENVRNLIRRCRSSHTNVIFLHGENKESITVPEMIIEKDFF